MSSKHEVGNVTFHVSDVTPNIIYIKTNYNDIYHPVTREDLRKAAALEPDRWVVMDGGGRLPGLRHTSKGHDYFVVNAGSFNAAARLQKLADALNRAGVGPLED